MGQRQPCMGLSGDCCDTDCIGVCKAQCNRSAALCLPDALAVCGRLESMGYIKMINDLDARIAASKVGQLWEPCKSAGFAWHQALSANATCLLLAISQIVCLNPAQSAVTQKRCFLRQCVQPCWLRHRAGR